MGGASIYVEHRGWGGGQGAGNLRVLSWAGVCRAWREMKAETQAEVREQAGGAWDNSSAGSQETEAERVVRGNLGLVWAQLLREVSAEHHLGYVGKLCAEDRQTDFQTLPALNFMPGSPCFFKLNFLICIIRNIFLCVILSWQL